MAISAVALRVTLGVVLCWALSALTDPGAIDDGKSLEWCAYTIITVAAPTLGSVAAKGLDRLLGTVLGGVVAVMICVALRASGVSSTMDTVYLSIATGAIAAVSVIAADAFNKDYSMKLFLITYLMIALGAENLDHIAGVASFAVMRTKGVVEGGLMVAILTVAMRPEAASVNAINQMGVALRALQELQENVWENGAVSTGWSLLSANRAFKLRVMETYIAPNGSLVDGQGNDPLDGTEGISGISPLQRLLTVPRGEFDGMGGLPLNTEEDMEEMEGRLEQIVDAIRAGLVKAESLAREGASEIYIGQLWGTAVFMPGLSYKWAQAGSWKVPKAEIDALSTTVRKIVRLYWSMQRAFQLGFDDEMMKVLAERYPPHMLSKMQNGAIDALGAILDALPKPGKLCPQSKKARLEALVHFCADMDMFLSIGADQRHGVNEILRRSYREPPRASKGGLAPLKPSSTTLQAGTHRITQQPETSAGSGCLPHEKMQRRMSIGDALHATLELPRNKDEHGMYEALMRERSSEGLAITDVRIAEEAVLEQSSPFSPASTPLLQQFDSQAPALFPDTANGHIAKVRWYSFLFLMERLSIAMVELHEDVDDLLSKLPSH